MPLSWRQREAEGCAQRPPAALSPPRCPPLCSATTSRGFHVEDFGVDSPGSVLAGLVEPVSQSAQDSRDKQRRPLRRAGERGGDSFEVDLPAAHSRRPGHGRRQSHAVSGWPVTSTAGEERPGSSAVWSALPSAAWGWGVGGLNSASQCNCWGASKTPHPAPAPGTPPHQGWGASGTRNFF